MSQLHQKRPVPPLAVVETLVDNQLTAVTYTTVFEDATGQRFSAQQTMFHYDLLPYPPTPAPLAE